MSCLVNSGAARLGYYLWLKLHINRKVNVGEQISQFKANLFSSGNKRLDAQSGTASKFLNNFDFINKIFCF
jgi:hypothetical protein